MTVAARARAALGAVGAEQDDRRTTATTPISTTARRSAGVEDACAAAAAGARSRGSVRRTAVASPVACPLRAVSIASTSSRSAISSSVVGVAAVEVLGRRAVDARRPARGDLGPPHLHVGQLLAHVLHRDGDLVLAVERDVAGEHLEQHDPERVEVGLAGDVVAERLLGRDVVGRAEHAAVGRQPVLVERARDAEVGDLRRALLVDEDVLRLDVAVDDAALVGGARARARSRSRRRPPRTIGSRPLRRMRSLSVSPSTYSKTMYGSPSSRPPRRRR